MSIVVIKYLLNYVLFGLVGFLLYAALREREREKAALAEQANSREGMVVTRVVNQRNKTLFSESFHRG